MKIMEPNLGIQVKAVGTDNNMEIQNNNPLLRFLDDSTVEMIKEIKVKAKEALEESVKTRKMLQEAQDRITELLNEMDK